MFKSTGCVLRRQTKLTTRYSNKFGRPKTGAKGIGRFCCRRLGKHLELITTAKLPSGQFQQTSVIFPWEDFEPGTELTEIECLGEVKISDKGETGTRLTIKHAPKDRMERSGFSLPKPSTCFCWFLIVVKSERGTASDQGFNAVINAPVDEVRF